MPLLSRPLRVLTYNIQTGISVHRYAEYFTKSWQYLLPSTQKKINLDKIAELIRSYDIVALQEVDLGSVRSKFINQVEYLAKKAGFPYWDMQRTRNLGLFAQQGNGVLSKFPIESTEYHKLPGLIPGRGVLLTQIGNTHQKLLLVILHLSLGPIAKQKQIAYLEKLLGGHPHTIIMGDLNCLSESKTLKNLTHKNNFAYASQGIKTFPSWSPFKDIDHILISSTLRVKEIVLLEKCYSDHLPVGVSLTLPPEIELFGY